MLSKQYLASALTALLCSPALAQSGSASESYVAVTRSLATSAGETSSASFSARVILRLNAAVQQSVSANYQLVSGPASIEGAMYGPGPIVYGVDFAHGDKDGAETRRLFGYGLDAAPQTVAFGPTNASILTTLSPTALDVVTPAGLNAHQNPLGPTFVDVDTPFGTTSRADAFRYLPALTNERIARVGSALELTMIGEPGSFFILALGLTSPGVAFAITPYEGALELVTAWKVLGGARFNPTGIKDTVFPITNDPSLYNISIDFQSLEISPGAPLSGAFTNVVNVTLVP